MNAHADRPRMRLLQNSSGTAMRVGEQTQEPNSTTKQHAEVIASDETHRIGRGSFVD